MQNQVLKTSIAEKILLIIGIVLICVSCDHEKITSHIFETDPYTNRLNWNFASKPYNIDLPKGNINYFMSQDFNKIDVYDDSLLASNEENDKVGLLRSKLSPSPLAIPGFINNSWSGLMQYLDESINLSEVDYIECQILENADVFPDVPVTMHIDIGCINEDFYRPGESTNADMEDGLVIQDSILDGEEDVGLDRIENGQPGDDPDDDYSNDKIMVNGFEEYPEINGTEGNNRLDTEDLNYNGMLDLNNSYIHYSFGLDSDEYLHTINTKGLRTYRIPVDIYEIVMDSNFNPDLQNLEYLRIWFEYPEETYVILISIKFVDLENESNSREIIKPLISDLE
ncbi:MAG: hypothetical protein KAU01_05230 [Candidatus Cloacimonetes bacterium]|nr:hypothetical protein [Candidatus Cloacimonadota bacterium]